MWTPDIVRARFIEAADTERRMPGDPGVSRKSGVWPAYDHSFEDRVGWGTRRLAEERDMLLRRMPPSAAAISRYYETLWWTAELIDDERRRHLVWAWADCRVSGRSFAEKCRREGWVKMTAYRRLETLFLFISNNLCNNSVLLRMPDEKWVLPDRPISGSDSIRLATGDDPAPDAHPAFQIFDGGRPRHTLISPQAVQRFEIFLEKTNRRRRREQQRRRKLGVGAIAASTADQQRGETAMPDQTENEKAAAAFDAQLSAMLKSARKRSEQLWPGVVGQLEIAQHHLRSMMHPDDAEKAR